jgi:hypothetical protein
MTCSGGNCDNGLADSNSGANTHLAGALSISIVRLFTWSLRLMEQATKWVRSLIGTTAATSGYAIRALKCSELGQWMS